MDAVDATTHYEIYATEEIPSLTAIIIDTNPRAWAAIKDALPIAQALANILVYVNSRLAYSSTNQVAIIASHTNRAVWLYPAPPKPPAAHDPAGDGDRDMADTAFAPHSQQAKLRRASANKFAPFAQLEASILASLRALMTATTAADLAATTTTQIAGALTLALHYINKTSLALTAAAAGQQAAPAAADPAAADPAAARAPASGLLRGLHARILVVSVSDAPAAQYIPTMNAVFAAAHAGIPVDVLALHGAPAFLQQASFLTRGAFLAAAASPQGLLAYLLFGLASSVASRRAVTTTTTGAVGDDAGAAATTAREQLVNPSAAAVDFRAACFCHRRVVDAGFVCSVCLSIFCEVPAAAECHTCGTRLALGRYGASPAVVQRSKKKKKKKRKLGPDGEPDVAGSSEAPGSAAGTPRPG